MTHGDDPHFLQRARAVSAELFRVLCDEPPTGPSGALGPVLVPFAGRADVLAFLRTVPAGTNRVELERLAALYCAAHPAPTAIDIGGGEVP
jgi:hypothetical protein